MFNHVTKKDLLDAMSNTGHRMSRKTGRSNGSRFVMNLIRYGHRDITHKAKMDYRPRSTPFKTSLYTVVDGKLSYDLELTKNAKKKLERKGLTLIKKWYTLGILKNKQGWNRYTRE